MSVRVAELEAVFTGDLSDFEAKAKKVQALSEQIDKLNPDLTVEADIVEAMAALDDIEAELDKIDGETAEVEVTADTEKVGDDLDDVAERLGDLDGKTATAKVDVDAKGARDGLDKASEGLDEFKDEANSTAREGAASFTGEFDDVADIIQETLANAFVGFGPAGAAAGLVAAAGIGIVIAKANEAAEEVNAAAEATNSLAGEIVDAGGRIEDVDFSSHFREWADEITNVRSAWEFWQDEAVTQLDDVRQAAADAGVDIDDLLAAMASGDVETASGLMRDYKDRLSDITPELEALQAKSAAYSAEIANGGIITVEWSAAEAERLRQLEAEKDGLDEVTSQLEGQVQQLREAEDRADRMAAASEGLTLQQYQLREALDEANQALTDSGSSARDAEQAELDLKEQVADTTQTVKDSAASNLDKRQALLDLADQIASTAAAEEEAKGTTEAYNKVIDRNRREFIDAAEAAGYTAKEAENLADEYGLIPKVVETDIKGDGSQARKEGRETRQYLNELEGVIDVLADTDNAVAQALAVQRYIDGLNATIDVYDRHVTAGNSYSRSGGITFADGGITEDHTAQIAPAGAWRLWAEPETGGEAYIPLSPAKRARSMDILAEVATRFGATLTKRANGSVDGGAPAVSGSVQVTAVLAPEDRALLLSVADRPMSVQIDGRELVTATRSAERRFGSR